LSHLQRAELNRPMTSCQSPTNQHLRLIDIFSLSLSHLLKSEKAVLQDLYTNFVTSRKSPDTTYQRRAKAEGFRPTFPDETLHQLAATSLHRSIDNRGDHVFCLILEVLFNNPSE
jgi:hypothetical protein